MSPNNAPAVPSTPSSGAPSCFDEPPSFNDFPVGLGGLICWILRRSRLPDMGVWVRVPVLAEEMLRVSKNLHR